MRPAASAPSAPLSRRHRPRQAAGSEEGGLASGPAYPHRRPFLPPACSPGFWGRHEAGQLLRGHEIQSGIYRVINVARAQGLKKWSAERLEGAPQGALAPMVLQALPLSLTGSHARGAPGPRHSESTSSSACRARPRAGPASSASVLGRPPRIPDTGALNRRCFSLTSWSLEEPDPGAGGLVPLGPLFLVRGHRPPLVSSPGHFSVCLCPNHLWYKDTSPTESGPAHAASFTFIFFKDPSPTQSHLRL